MADLIHEARLAYAGYGWSTLLLHGIDDHCCTCGDVKCASAGKHPRFAGKSHQATSDAVRINADTRFGTSNIGLHLGSAGLVVIDIDPRNGGIETMRRLEELYGPIWSPLTVRTGGGGEHRYFKVPPDRSRLPGKLGPGVDLLWGNRFPVLPPSRHVSGKRYAWAGDRGPIGNVHALPTLPSFLLKGEPPTDTEGDGDWSRLRPRPEETTHEVAKLESALSMISADCSREDWRDVVFAIHSTSWSCAEQIARDWSLSAPERWDETEFRKLWESARSRRVGGVTEATIYHRAIAAGWAPPAHAKAAIAEPIGDIANSRLFAAAWRKRLLRNNAAKCWMRYEDGIWKTCAKGEEMQAAKEVADRILEKAVAEYSASPTPVNKTRLGQATGIHANAKRIRAMIDLAATEPEMSVADSSQFDADPQLLGVPGGAIDLRNAKPINPSPGLLITKCTGVSFDSAADCPRWKSVMQDIFPDPEVRDFVQRAVGYTLTGLIDEEVLFFAYGDGANGKSLFTNVISGILGDYATTVSSVLLAKTANDSESRLEKTKLAGSRMGLANEIGISEIWNDQRTKEIVSRERIAARELYGKPFEFLPSHKLWIRGNHLPGILDSGHGMWRRIVLIPFERQFGPEEQLPDLDRQLLAAEGSGILNWALEGCLAYQAMRLRPPKVIRDIVSSYREDTDVVGTWLKDECIIEVDARVSTAEIYESYRSYHVEASLKPASRPSFVRMFKQRGFGTQRSNGRDYITGLRMKPEVTWPEKE